MGKESPQAPPPPDPVKTAQAQTGSNIGTAIANATIGNANTYGPTGSTINNRIGSEFIIGPGGERFEVPRYEQRTTLSPEQQQLYDQQTQLGSSLNNLAQGQVGRLGDTLGKPIDTSGLTPLDDLTSLQGRQRVEDALFQRLNPQLERDRNSLENNLTNQGFVRGSEAFNSAMDQYGRQANDARLAVTAQGLGEQQGQFGMQQANRQRSLQEMLALRNQPINEISALMSGGQVSLPNAPGYNAPQVGNTDIGGYMYNSAALANDQYKQQVAQQNAAMGGMFGLGQAGIMGAARMAPFLFPSDRRLKRDIRDLGIRLVNGLKLYAYRYLWADKPIVGVMADEVVRVNPNAVADIDGFYAVNYRAL